MVTAITVSGSKVTTHLNQSYSPLIAIYNALLTVTGNRILNYIIPYLRLHCTNRADKSPYRHSQLTRSRLTVNK